MRWIALIGALVWLATATSAHALSVDEARHLVSRTGFGASVQEIEAMRPLDRAAAVDRLISGLRSVPTVPPPAFVSGPRPDWPAFYRSRDEEVRRTFNRARDAEAAQLKAWWLAEMAATPSPLTERLVLFWHNHFTSSVDKVRHIDLLFRQNQLFRSHAAGDVRALMHAIPIDAAMLRYLDGNTSRRGRPNENFAREWFELFTLGEGAYTEADIKEAARAFTGWTIEEATGTPRLLRNQHDDGEKRLFGQIIPAGPDSQRVVVDLTLAQPAAARFLVGKLWREFVSPTPDPATVERLATRLRQDWQLAPVLRALLLDPAFWAEETRGSLIKSPVDLIIGTIRSLELVTPDMAALVTVTRLLGQDLFNPPNVRGWPGHEAWIGTQTLLVRRDALQRLARGEGVRGGGANEAGMMAGGMMAAGAAPAAVASLRGRAVGVAGWLALYPRLGEERAVLLAVPPVDRAETGDRLARVERWMLDPAYHVK
ncbi:MAG: DUF1800 domain-containing protein [Alphaproteobacteria bacterium]|nr:MAG: DUF1800 domain-containing protein [Alphaproteobacteria bacterium]